MWDYQDSIEAAAPRERVWARYRDVSTWPEWQPGVESARLDGPFVTGSHGIITTGHGSAPFTLTQVTDGVGYTQETRLDAETVLRSHCTLESLPGGGTRIVHRSVLAGPPSSDSYDAAVITMLIRSITEGLGALRSLLRATS